MYLYIYIYIYIMCIVILCIYLTSTETNRCPGRGGFGTCSVLRNILLRETAAD